MVRGSLGDRSLGTNLNCTPPPSHRALSPDNFGRTGAPDNCEGDNFGRIGPLITSRVTTLVG